MRISIYIPFLLYIFVATLHAVEDEEIPSNASEATILKWVSEIVRYPEDFVGKSWDSPAALNLRCAGPRVLPYVLPLIGSKYESIRDNAGNVLFQIIRYEEKCRGITDKRADDQLVKVGGGMLYHTLDAETRRQGIIIFSKWLLEQKIVKDQAELDRITQASLKAIAPIKVRLEKIRDEKKITALVTSIQTSGYLNNFADDKKVRDLMDCGEVALPYVLRLILSTDIETRKWGYDVILSVFERHMKDDYKQAGQVEYASFCKRIGIPKLASDQNEDTRKEGVRLFSQWLIDHELVTDEQDMKRIMELK